MEVKEWSKSTGDVEVVVVVGSHFRLKEDSKSAFRSSPQGTRRGWEETEFLGS